MKRKKTKVLLSSYDEDEFEDEDDITDVDEDEDKDEDDYMDVDDEDTKPVKKRATPRTKTRAAVSPKKTKPAASKAKAKAAMMAGPVPPDSRQRLRPIAS